jgi:hypothetical protein
MVKMQAQRLYEKSSGAVVSQPSQHDPDHSYIDPGFFATGKQFIVLGQAAPGGKPGEGSFHYESAA